MSETHDVYVKFEVYAMDELDAEYLVKPYIQQLKLNGVSIVNTVVATPIDMILFCPNCGLQHIDEADKDDIIPNPFTDGKWTNPPHRSHLCAACGHIWRPADVPTNGVHEIKTVGKNDSRKGSHVVSGVVYADVARYRWSELERIRVECLRFEPCGSRVTCNPAPLDTDIDYLCLIDRTFDYYGLKKDGWDLGGSQPEDLAYPLDPDICFSSFTKGNINLIITESEVFFDRFMDATRQCTELNLLDKADRIKLFQKILYNNIME